MDPKGERMKPNGVKPAGPHEIDEGVDEEQMLKISNFRKLHSSNYITDTQISMQNQSIEEALKEGQAVDDDLPKAAQRPVQINSKVIYNRIQGPSEIRIIDGKERDLTPQPGAKEEPALQPQVFRDEAAEDDIRASSQPNNDSQVSIGLESEKRQATKKVGNQQRAPQVGYRDAGGAGQRAAAKALMPSHSGTVEDRASHDDSKSRSNYSVNIDNIIRDRLDNINSMAQSHFDQQPKILVWKNHLFQGAINDQSQMQQRTSQMAKRNEMLLSQYSMNPSSKLAKISGSQGLEKKFMKSVISSSATKKDGDEANNQQLTNEKIVNIQELLHGKNLRIKELKLNIKDLELHKEEDKEESSGDEVNIATGTRREEPKEEPYYRNGQLIEPGHRYWRYEQELMQASYDDKQRKDIGSKEMELLRRYENKRLSDSLGVNPSARGKNVKNGDSNRSSAVRQHIEIEYTPRQRFKSNVQIQNQIMLDKCRIFPNNNENAQHYRYYHRSSLKGGHDLMKRGPLDQILSRKHRDKTPDLIVQEYMDKRTNQRRSVTQTEKLNIDHMKVDSSMTQSQTQNNFNKKGSMLIPYQKGFNALHGLTSKQNMHFTQNGFNMKEYKHLNSLQKRYATALEKSSFDRKQMTRSHRNSVAVGQTSQMSPLGSFRKYLDTGKSNGPEEMSQHDVSPSQPQEHSGLLKQELKFQNLHRLFKKNETARSNNMSTFYKTQHDTQRLMNDQRASKMHHLQDFESPGQSLIGSRYEVMQSAPDTAPSSGLRQVEHLRQLRKLKLCDYQSTQRQQMNKTQTFRAKNFGQQPKSDIFDESSGHTLSNIAKKNFRMLDYSQKKSVMKEYVMDRGIGQETQRVKDQRSQFGSELAFRNDMSYTNRNNAHMIGTDAPLVLNQSVFHNQQDINSGNQELVDQLSFSKNACTQSQAENTEAQQTSFSKNIENSKFARDLKMVEYAVDGSNDYTDFRQQEQRQTGKTKSILASVKREQQVSQSLSGPWPAEPIPTITDSMLYSTQRLGNRPNDFADESIPKSASESKDESKAAAPSEAPVAQNQEIAESFSLPQHPTKEQRLQVLVSNFHNVRSSVKRHFVNQKQEQMNQIIQQNDKEFSKYLQRMATPTPQVKTADGSYSRKSKRSISELRGGTGSIGERQSIMTRSMAGRVEISQGSRKGQGEEESSILDQFEMPKREDCIELVVKLIYEGLLTIMQRNRERRERCKEQRKLQLQAAPSIFGSQRSSQESDMLSIPSPTKPINASEVEEPSSPPIEPSKQIEADEEYIAMDDGEEGLDEPQIILKRIRKQLQKISKQQSRIVNQSMGRRIKMDDPQKLEKLKIFMSIIDNDHWHRMKRQRRAKESQYEFVRLYQADPSLIKSRVKTKLEDVDKRVENDNTISKKVKDWEIVLRQVQQALNPDGHTLEWAELVEIINDLQDQEDFGKTYEERDIIADVAGADPEFKDQLNETLNETCKLLNSILKPSGSKALIDVEEYLSKKQKEKGENGERKSFILDASPVLTSNTSQKFDLKISSHFLSPLSPRSPTSQEVSMHSSGSQNLQIDQPPPMPQKIAKFVKTLNAVFPNEETNMFMGQKYEYIDVDDGIYANEFIRKIRNHLERSSTRAGKEFDMPKAESLLQNLDHLMQKDVYRNQFFEEIKKTLSPRNQDSEVRAMHDYFELCRANHQVPAPQFLKITQNALIIIDHKVPEAEAQIIKQFLVFNRDSQVNRVHHLVLENCHITDQSFALILEGILEQQGMGEEQERDKSKSKGPLRTLIYTNNELGPKSLAPLELLIPNLRDLQITGPQSTMNTMNQFVSCLYSRVQSMTKIKLSRVNLNDPKLIDEICSLMSSRYQKFVHHFDLSWCNLSPKNLAKIAGELCYCVDNIRSINLSYNSLNFNKKTANKDDYQQSMQFMEDILIYIRKQNVLNHLDISGMNFGPKQMIQLCNEIARSSFICSVHMNDCGINLAGQNCNNEFREQILDIFGIRDEAEEEEKDPEDRINRQIVDSKGLDQLMKDKMNIVDRSTIKEKENNVKASEYKNHYIREKQNLNLKNKYKMMEDHTHVNRCITTKLDSFCVYRKFNFPELVFNQNPSKDAYYDLTQTELWRYSTRTDKCNDCYICQKQSYTMIFYERDDPDYDESEDDLNLSPAPGKSAQRSNGGSPAQRRTALHVGRQPSVLSSADKWSSADKQTESHFREQNWDLTEITDSSMISQIKEHLNLSRQDLADPNDPPFICGTIINGGYTRKLKMMRADMFSLSSISQSKEFVKDHSQSRQLKKGILRICEQREKRQDVESPIKKRMRGWNRVLYDKCSKNQIWNTRVINQPESLKGREASNAKQTYTFACFLPAGHHEFLIYDPKTERAYSKSIIMDIGDQDFYPEQPTCIYQLDENRQQISRSRQDIWYPLKKIEGSNEHLNFAYLNDFSTLKQLEAFKINTQYPVDEESLETNTEIILMNYQTVQECFQILQENCLDVYPQITLDSVLDLFKSDPEAQQMINKFEKDLIKVAGAFKQKNRAFLFAVLINISAILNLDRKEPLVLKLQATLSKFVERFNRRNAHSTSLRAQIRQDKQLNQLLVDNDRLVLKTLEKLAKPTFSIDAAADFIEKLCAFKHENASRFASSCPASPNPPASPARAARPPPGGGAPYQMVDADGEVVDIWREAQRCYIRSKQLVYSDEPSKYNGLSLDEFREFICRVSQALPLLKGEGRIAEAMFSLMEVLLSYYTERLLLAEQASALKVVVQAKKPQKGKKKGRQDNAASKIAGDDDPLEQEEVVPLVDYSSSSSEEILHD